ncbi:synemin [Discoglossus pictus]
MLHIIRGFGDEKSQLRELNSRLDQYLSRVRQLEGENQLLVEEIHRLRLERNAEWAQGYQAEMSQLRRRIEELTVERCEAEIERDNIWHEIQTLQELWEQVRAMRLSIEQQLEIYKKDLQQARNSQAALEELYTRLQQECHILHGSHQQELVTLREQALKMPLHIAMQGTVHPSLNLQEVQSFSLELSSYWEETFLIYQKKIKDMEENLRLEEENRWGVEEEAREQSLRVEELHREYEELLRIKKMLEDELLKMKEKYRVEIEEYLIIIEELESERETIRVTITERLKDYHELMQLKTGLSLEVAAYRALLESENKQGRYIWTDRTVRSRPAGSVTSSTIDKSIVYSGIKHGEERKQFPLKRTNEDIRRITQTSNVQRTYPRTVPQTVIRTKTADMGTTNSSYVNRVLENTALERNDAFSRRYDFQNIYSTGPSKIVKSPSLTQTREVIQNITHKEVRDARPSICQTARPKEISRGQSNITEEDIVKNTNSHKGLETNIVKKKQVETKIIEVERSHLQEKAMPTLEEAQKNEIPESVVEKENTIIESKVLEIPIKKERKKREQAKKRKEDAENAEASDKKNVTEDKVEPYESAYTEKFIRTEEKLQDCQVGFDIPIRFEVEQKEDSCQKSHVEDTWENQTGKISKEMYANEEATIQRNIKQHESSREAEGSKTIKDEDSEVVIMSLEHMAEREMVDDILRHYGQPSVLDDASEIYVEKRQQSSDGTVKTEIFVQSKTKEEVDFYDETDLVDMWSKKYNQAEQEGTTGSAECLLEDLHSRNVTKTTITGDVKGDESEDWIGNVIHTGLKGRPGMTVNVEIIEESIGSFGIETPELTTPFQVEEAEDSYHVAADAKEQHHESVKAENMQGKMQASEVTSHVEEVTEAEDMGDEASYFVSVPDDIYSFQNEEEETLKGQIHIEEESHVKYAYQDEFLQGSQNRKALSELLKLAASNEQDAIIHTTTEESNIHKLEDQELKEEELHTETVVIEKEIKVPHELQSSIISLLSKDNKDPQQQLKGAIECLQESLPKDLVKELSTLAGEEQSKTSNLAVDIKKIDQTVDSGKVTIVAEINVSQTMDTDSFDAEQFIKKVSKEDEALLHSTSDDSEEIRTSQDSKGREISEHNQASYHSITLGANNGAEYYSSEEIIHKMPETTTTTEMHLSPDVSRFIKHIQLGTPELISQEETISGTKEEELSSTETNRSFHHIKVGPREMYSTEQIIFEGPISEELKIRKNTEELTDQNKSIRHIKISSGEKFPTEQIIFEGPIFKIGESSAAGTLSLKEGYTDDSNQTAQSYKIGFEQFQTDEQVNKSQGFAQTEAITHGSKTVTHFKINSGESKITNEFIFEGSIPKVQKFIGQRHIETDKPDGNSSPIEHKFGSQTIHIAKQAKHQGIITEPFKLGDAGNLDESEEQSNVNTSVHHIKLSPNREQIIFEGPIFKNLQFGGKDNNSYLEETRDSSSSIRNFHLGAQEMHTSERVMFEGPVSETYESSDVRISSPSGDSSESERSIKHIKLGPTEKSFTFQMDITKVATKYQGESRVEESAIAESSQNVEGQPEKSQSYHELTDESGYGEEEVAAASQYPYEVELQSHGQHVFNTSEFNKTVQLQRIVGQKSMASDDKKVAVVYLEDDDDDEPDQDYLRRSF